MLYLISLLSFLLPTQIGLHFNNFDSTVYGFRIDYLIPTLYLTDIVVLLIIVFGLQKLKITKRYVSYAIAYLLFASYNIYISDYFVPSLYKWFKVTEMLLLGIIVFKTKLFDVFRHFIKPLSYSTILVCLVGIGQFINQGSIGGVFYFLGERDFLFSDPNIAPYPYATFSHPNSFAGFLLVFGILILMYRKKFSQKLFWTTLMLAAVNLILTNSLNVYVAIGLLLMLKLSKNFVYSFFALDVSQRFVVHRIELIQASWQIIKENFWFGVGLNNFIPNLVKVSKTFVNAWELQPVHNIFLLVFSEVGLVGLVLFSALIFSSLISNHYALYAILITGLSDHYWLTLQQNMLLFTYVLTISNRIKVKN